MNTTRNLLLYVALASIWLGYGLLLVWGYLSGVLGSRK
jgi:hypothetical protein